MAFHLHQQLICWLDYPVLAEHYLLLLLLLLLLLRCQHACSSS
jgi:hypothetical protein